VLSVTVVSVISLVGIVFIAVNPVRLQKLVFVLISLAVGGLLGDCFFHLLPEAIKNIPNSSEIGFLVAFGLLSFFVIEKFLLWKHERYNPLRPDPKIKPLGYISLVADSVHNLFDGVLIGSSYLVSFKVGLATTVAIIFHEIPHEIGNFGTLIHAGVSIRRALVLNFLTACTAFLGTVTALLFGTQIGGFSNLVLPFAGGGFIYLACCDLIPELKKFNSLAHSLLQGVIIISGLILLYLFTFLEQ